MQQLTRIYITYTIILAALGGLYIYLCVKTRQINSTIPEVMSLVHRADNDLGRINQQIAEEARNNVFQTVEQASDINMTAITARLQNFKNLPLASRKGEPKKSWAELQDQDIRKLEDRCAQYDTLEVLKKQSETGINVFTQFLPVIALKNSHPKAGEPVNGIIYLQQYFPDNYKTIRLSVNGKVLPMEKGIGRFQELFTMAGDKTYKIDMSITNPMTHQTESWDQNLKIHINQ